MAKIRLPMHCPEDIQSWLYRNKVIVTDINAPYEVEFEAPMDVLINMVKEGWVDNGCSAAEMIGSYILGMTDLDNSERFEVSQRIVSVLVDHMIANGVPITSTNLGVRVNVADGEFMWWDDDEAAWAVSKYRFEFDADRGWGLVVDPMPIKWFI